VFCAAFVAGICLSQSHEQRWVIQILPLLTLLAAVSLDAVGQILAPPIRRVLRPSLVVPVALVAITAIVAIHPAAELVDANTNPSTRTAARHWIVTHIRRGSRVLQDRDTVALDRTQFAVDDRFNPRTHTVGDYQRSGYQYVVVNVLEPRRYRGHEAAFYRDLVCDALRVATFAATTTRSGWTIGIFGLQVPPGRHFGPPCSARDAH
jgi:hypothetical protein